MIQAWIFQANMPPVPMKQYIAEDTFAKISASDHPSFPSSKAQLKGIIDSVAHQLIGSIVEFAECVFYITSGDFYLHNNPDLDDCAYGILSKDYKATPTASIKSKMYLGKHRYHELSIFWGFFELLVTGCTYYNKRDGVVRGSLGSSLMAWRHETMTTDRIFVPSAGMELITTPRLPNNYTRRCSHNLWGYHLLLKKFVDGYTPIIPLQFHNHKSQTDKKVTVAHFASKTAGLLYNS